MDEVAQEIGAFYAAHRQELYTYALSLAGSPACAEDAVHECVRKLLSQRRLPLELRPYAFRCVRNAALDLHRQAARERRKLEDFRAIFDETQITPAHAPVVELLESLSEREREIVVLKVYSGLTFREIAEVCGSKQGTVAASYWRSLQKLRSDAAVKELEP